MNFVDAFDAHAVAVALFYALPPQIYYASRPLNVARKTTCLVSAARTPWVRFTSGVPSSKPLIRIPLESRAGTASKLAGYTRRIRCLLRKDHRDESWKTLGRIDQQFMNRPAQQSSARRRNLVPVGLHVAAELDRPELIGQPPRKIARPTRVNAGSAHVGAGVGRDPEARLGPREPAERSDSACLQELVGDRRGDCSAVAGVFEQDCKRDLRIIRRRVTGEPCMRLVALAVFGGAGLPGNLDGQFGALFVQGVTKVAGLS